MNDNCYFKIGIFHIVLNATKVEAVTIYFRSVPFQMIYFLIYEYVRYRLLSENVTNRSSSKSK